jgi:cyclohexanecarboxyl-CoA dehydrogenase
MFGLSYEGVAFQIAEHSTMLAAARLLAYQTLWLRDHGEPHTKEAAMVKWMAPKAAVDAIHARELLNGSMGYDNELPHGQRLRDIMKGVVAREIFGREFVAYR